MTDTNLDSMINQLGYTPAWFDLGIVNAEYVQNQYGIFLRSDDKNPEHYRHGTFLEYLRKQERLSDDQFNAILRLSDDGPDKVDLTSNRYHELLISSILTDKQLSVFSETKKFQESRSLRRLFLRLELQKKLIDEGLTEELFALLLDTDDGDLHLNLLDHPDLRRGQLQQLAEYGANKPIRNRANAMLKSRRFRE